MADGEGFQIPAGEIVLETAVDFEGVDRDLEEMRKRGIKAGEETGEGFRKGVGEGAGKAADQTQELDRRLASTGESAEEAAEGAKRADQDIGEMAETAESAAQTSAGLAVVMGRRLVGGLKGVVGWLGRTTSGFLSLSAEGLQQAGRGLKELGHQLRESESRWASFGIVVEGAGSVLESVAVVAAKAASAITGIHVAAGLAAGSLAVASKRAADDFAPSWNRVLTILPDSVEEVDSLKRSVGDLRAELGLSADVANDTFYQVLSAMPEVAEDPERALKVLRAALEVTATGFADGETAARAITSVLNAFNLEAEQATEVADKLFAAQDQGVLTFQQVATEIGKVSNLTSSMNADFEDLLGILATVTPSGENVSQTMTQIRSVLGEMLDPTDELNEALGGSATGFVKDKGLLAALRQIAEVTEGNPEVIAQMFGRKEAQSLIITLSQNMDTFEEKTRNVVEASGLLNENLETMNDSSERAKEITDQELDEALRRLGERFSAVGLKGRKAFNAILRAVNDLDEKVREEGGLFRGGALGPIGALVEAAQTVEEIQEGVERGGGIGELLTPADAEIERFEQFVDLIEEAEEGQDRIRSRPDRPGILDVDLSAGEGPQTGEEIERPESPAEAVAEEIERARSKLQTAALLDFVRTKDLQEYELALDKAQRRVNDLVEAEIRRLQQAGVSGEHLEALLKLYDESVEFTEDQRVALDDLNQSLSDYAENLRTVAGRLREIEQPDLPDVGSEGPAEGPAGFRAAFESGADASGVTEEEMSHLLDTLRQINEEAESSDEAFRMAQAALNDTDISVEQLRESTSGLANVILTELLDALPDWAAEMLGIAGVEEDAEENTRDLADEVENLAQLAGGVLQLADAFGIFGDEASDALQQGVSAATQLAQGVDSLKDALAEGASGFALAGPIGAIAGGAAGLIGAIGGLIGGGGPSETELRLRREAEETAEALRELRTSAEAVRSVFEEVPGEDIETVREFLEGFEVPSATPLGTAPDAEGIREALDQAGLSLSDLEAIAEAAGIEINDLKKALDGQATFTAAVQQEIDALSDAMRELSLERAFSTFQGQMDLLQQEFEVFDIDDPVRQLERMREVLLGLETDLPPALERVLAGADLSTAEGRQRVEDVAGQLIRQLQAGELTPEDLGGLTVEQLRDLIGQLEGTIDEAAREEEGQTGGFEQTRGITEITANRLTGRLTTLDVRAMKRNELLGRILTQLGGDVPTNLGTGAAPAPTSRRSGGGGAGDVHVAGDLVGSMTVDLPPGVADHLDGETAPENLGGRIGEGFLRKVDRGLDQLRQERSR